MPSFPYASSPGPVAKTFEHLRNRSFPKELTSETLRKLGVAPKNESYVINVIRFLGIIDDEGKRVDANSEAFNQHDDGEFAKQFQTVVRNAYAALFDLHGDDTWSLDKNALIQFFRSTDRSSVIVGTRQAMTFQLLAALSGFSEMPARREASGKKLVSAKSAVQKKVAAAPAESKPIEKEVAGNSSVVTNVADPRVGLTVRIEVNLPADGNQATYDAIFKSIRKNLIDGD